MRNFFEVEFFLPMQTGEEDGCHLFAFEKKPATKKKKEKKKKLMKIYERNEAKLLKGWIKDNSVFWLEGHHGVKWARKGTRENK